MPGQLDAFLEKHSGAENLHPLLRACLSPVHTFSVRLVRHVHEGGGQCLPNLDHVMLALT